MSKCVRCEREPANNFISFKSRDHQIVCSSDLTNRDGDFCVPCWNEILRDGQKFLRERRREQNKQVMKGESNASP